MKRIAGLCLALLGLGAVAMAQVGVSGFYVSNQADGWESSVKDNAGDPVVALPGQGWQAGIDYWFRLKKKRVEFLPTLAFSAAEQQLISPSGIDQEVNFVMRQLSFFWHTQLYLLDLGSDCDCPTFSKDGNSLKKGLFLQLSPGLSYFSFSAEGYPVDFDDRHVAPGIGAGLGLDLGFSDFLTVTPMFRVLHFPSTTWEGLSGNGSDVINVPGVSDETSLWQYQAGLRVGFRPDERRRRWRR